jgi:hypothetical protein
LTRALTRRLFIRGSMAGALLAGCGGQRGRVRGDRSIAEDALPHYSALDQNAKLDVPEALRAAAKSDLLIDRAQELQKRLMSPPNRPPDDQSLFTFFVASEQVGVITYQAPLSGTCVPVFMAAIDAGEYKRLLLRDIQTRYMVSSAVQFLKMVRDVEPTGVRTIAFNRCPRFAADSVRLPTGVVFNLHDPGMIATRFLQTPSDVIEVWSVHTAKRHALVEVSLAFALKEARAGHLEIARDIALDALGHITLNEPHLHLVLGQAAIGLRDARLFGEARAFLEFLKRPELTAALDRAHAAGVPDFSEQTFA